MRRLSEFATVVDILRLKNAEKVRINWLVSWNFGSGVGRSGELRNRLYACKINDNINARNIPAFFYCS
jgi:hypothetical protein